MKVDGRSQLERFEGRRKSAYKDHLGWLTIGVGICIDSRKNCGLYDVEIDFILLNRIRIIKQQMESLFPAYPSLAEPRQWVLINMIFALGMEGAQNFKKFLESLEKGDFSGAATELTHSRWAEQDPKRVAILAKQMKDGVWIDPDKG